MNKQKIVSVFKCFQVFLSHFKSGRLEYRSFVMCGLGDRLNKHYKKYERVALETRNLMYKSLVYVYLRQFYQFSENRIPETTTWNRNYNNNNNIEYLSIHIVNTANHSSPGTEHRNPLFARHNVPTLEVFLNPPQQRVKLVWPVST